MTTMMASRRAVLAGGLAGFVLGFALPRASGPALARAEAAGPQALTAFIRVASDDTVTILSKHIEFGQGPYTGLATLIAEEMDADWGQMRAEGAPAGPEYANLAFGMQGTGGSTAIANSYDQHRKAGAAARAMLVAAAAARWGVPAAEIGVANGVVSHAGSGRSARFGELAAEAARMPAPAEPALKDPKDFTLIGTDRPRLDTAAKLDGSAQFTIDVDLPGMLVVQVVHPPRFGATVAAVDSGAAEAIPGVRGIRTIPYGVAIYADSYWSAHKARQKLSVTWDESAAERRSTAAIVAEYRALLDQPGRKALALGDAAAALTTAAEVVTEDYEFPFLAHAPMEPLDCVIRRSANGAEAWFGSQLPTVDQGTMAHVLGLKPEQVRINVLMAGGSFGRRAQPDSHLAAEAAMVAAAWDADVPLKLIWTREDDLRGGYYRPIYLHRLSAGLDASGNIVGWTHRIVGQSILTGGPFEPFLVKDGIDATSVEGANELPYDIGAFALDLHTTKVGVPVLWWRSVGSTHTAFSTETFLDELLDKAGRDPVEGRLALMGAHPRHAAVLKAAAELAKRGGPVPEGRARGIAVHKSFGSYVAQIVEVSDGGGQPRVHRVWAAVDVGRVINPNIVKAQVEGGVGYGLGAVLYNAVTMTDGVVDQTNFDRYWPLRMRDMPQVEVAIVPSEEPPTGIGEPGVPPLGPALANAWRRLTGRKVRRLPFVDVPPRPPGA